MDNKITKKRLSNFFAYEWIKIAVVVLLAVLFFELIFTMTAPHLSFGQQFKLIYDEGVSGRLDNNLIEVIISEGDKNGFSYEIQKIEAEVMQSGENNALSLRYKTYDADIVITEKNKRSDNTLRVNSIIDNLNVWSFEKAILDAEAYLNKFVKDQLKDQDGASLVYENLDQAKIENAFTAKMAKDKRFRKKDVFQAGLKAEKERLKMICSDVADIKYLLETHPELFYKYTKYTQATEIAKNTDNYQSTLERLQAQKEMSYGILPEKLMGGKHKASEYFKSNETTENVVVVSFDFIGPFEEYQFENLRFFVSVIDNFSNFLQGR